MTSAIVGMAARLPGARDLDQFWQVLVSGACTVRDAPHGRWSVERFLHPNPAELGFSYSFAGGYIDQPLHFDPLAFGISPREAAQIDPQQRLLLELVWEALEDAGIPPSGIAGQKIGVYVGASNVDYQGAVSIDQAVMESHFITGISLAIASNRLSYTFDLKGPSMTVDTACSSSIVALDKAASAIERGEIDTA
ncbi:MAG: polyketide synthase, partial [Comamonadaceae bacterium]